MLDLDRTTLPVRLAKALEKDIRKMTWTDRLPGYRVLARHYGVSRVTCDEAFAVLEKRGILAPAEPRRSRRIVVDTLSAGSRERIRAGTLLVVIDKNQQDASSDPLLAKLHEYWTRRHGKVVQVSDDLARFKNPRTRLAGWIRRENPDCLLLYVVPSIWSAAARDTGLPVHMLGGALPRDGTPVSGSGFELIDAYQKILERLLSLGHHRILSPTHLARERLHGAVVKAYARVFGGDETDHRARVPLYREPDPKVWQSNWHRSFTRHRPTAVVVENSCALLSLYGYCAACGIRIPRDLSVVCASDEKELLWAYPPPTRTRYPNEKAIRYFQNWARHGFKGDSFRFFPLEWIEGDTLAPPRKSRE